MRFDFFKKKTGEADNMAAQDHLFSLHNLRDMDRDRYLACLLSPSHLRIPLAILYSFNAELARVRDLASNPLAGAIRLQWWKDIFESSRDNILSESKSPFSIKLVSIINQYSLPYQFFFDMIEARFFDPYNDSIFDCKQLEIYAFKIASSLIHLATIILSDKKKFDIIDVIKHAGIAQFIGELILLLSKHCNRGQLYLPLDILGAVGLDRESFFSGKNSERISLVIKIFAELGLEHLVKARKEMHHISPDIFPAFIPVSITENILKNAQNNGIKILNHPHKIHRLIRQWYMLSATIKKRF
ncbi:phytoene synthase [Candidatus Liberibacter solanacearum]|uniref:Phytoene synthase n=2 Tax=Candidatus Liberibacter solanacearum TaxID=556287 RepID=A0A0F4VM75_9HYPH|nr:squalene/phytoene synthase family protein [Candidatus Liberibacter solanacearum]KJZ81782.1 Phytoene synthase [Candidatus Liberibacter solanacearum]KQC48845.1 phytoene synthase [Candidatus Liberibacter solanacearum]